MQSENEPTRKHPLRPGIPACAVKANPLEGLLSFFYLFAPKVHLSVLLPLFLTKSAFGDFTCLTRVHIDSASLMV